MLSFFPINLQGVHWIFHLVGKNVEEFGVAFFMLLVLPIGLDRLFVGDPFAGKAVERLGCLLMGVVIDMQLDSACGVRPRSEGR